MTVWVKEWPWACGELFLSSQAKGEVWGGDACLSGKARIRLRGRTHEPWPGTVPLWVVPAFQAAALSR